MEEIKITVPIRVAVSADGMEAFVDFNPIDLPQGAESRVEPAHLRDAIHERKVVKGVILQQARECLEKIRGREPFSNVLIARGAPPQDGTDAEFKLVEPRPASGGETEQAGGAEDPIDFRARGTIRFVAKAELIGVKREAAAGRDGFKVDGQVLPATGGADTTPVAGKNVEIVRNPDGLLEYHAVVGGSYQLIDNRIEITQVTVIQGDVNFSTGNIRCKGNLEVKGGVANGFKIEVEGDLAVHEVVEAAEIVAGGDVHLFRGIKGQGRALIRCGGSLRALYMERATVEAGGEVEIGSALMDCNLASGARVKVLKGKGIVMGGVIRAAKGIEVKKLGSDLAGLTSVEVGIDFVKERELKDISAQLGKIGAVIAKIERSVSREILQSQDMTWVPEAQRSRVQDIAAQWKGLVGQREEMTLRRDQLVGRDTSGSRERPMIRVNEKLSSRVKIRIGPCLMTTDREYGGVTIYGDADKREIRIIQR